MSATSQRPLAVSPIAGRSWLFQASLFSLLVGTSQVLAAEVSVDEQLQDTARALESLNQSYAYHGLRSGHGSAVVGGSRYQDWPARQRAGQARSKADPLIYHPVPKR